MLYTQPKFCDDVIGTASEMMLFIPPKKLLADTTIPDNHRLPPELECSQLEGPNKALSSYGSSDLTPPSSSPGESVGHEEPFQGAEYYKWKLYPEYSGRQKDDDAHAASLLGATNIERDEESCVWNDVPPGVNIFPPSSPLWPRVAFPVLVVAPEGQIEPLLAAIAYQRLSCGINLPVVGLESCPCGGALRLRIAWTEETQLGPQEVCHTL